MVAAGEEVTPSASEVDALDESFARFVVALSERGWVGERLALSAVGDGYRR